MPNLVFQTQAGLIGKLAAEGELLIKALEGYIQSTADVAEHLKVKKVGRHSLLASLHNLQLLFRVKIKLGKDGDGQGFICAHIPSLGDPKEVSVCERQFKPCADAEGKPVTDISHGKPCTREEFVEKILLEVAVTLVGKDLPLGVRWKDSGLRWKERSKPSKPKSIGGRME